MEFILLGAAGAYLSSRHSKKKRKQKMRLRNQNQQQANGPSAHLVMAMYNGANNMNCCLLNQSNNRCTHPLTNLQSFKFMLSEVLCKCGGNSNFQFSDGEAQALAYGMQMGVMSCSQTESNLNKVVENIVLFFQADKDRSGFVDQTELSDMFKKKRYTFSQTFLDEVMRQHAGPMRPGQMKPEMSLPVFLHVITVLKRATRGFAQKDYKRNGYADVNRDSFWELTSISGLY